MKQLKCQGICKHTSELLEDYFSLFGQVFSWIRIVSSTHRDFNKYLLSEWLIINYIYFLLTQVKQGAKYFLNIESLNSSYYYGSWEIKQFVQSYIASRCCNWDLNQRPTSRARSLNPHITLPGYIERKHTRMNDKMLSLDKKQSFSSLIVLQENATSKGKSRTHGIAHPYKQLV